ncbi:hypothetical protein BKA93DRAFT_878287 [Sparassis latifolia]|uniref:Uncharacterized protein n=1 Tax=Sparassis crispa TaxID=139825 RepID=A0A401GMT4_9APHY|nr:hypothetical protein SCP_0505770 [Sparassis crispa]GBE83523.1 hypothetical protein SCP_0505770 [Sparassis crispa]
MHKCRALSRLPKAGRLKSLNYRRTTPGSSAPLYGNISPDLAGPVDRNHPANRLPHLLLRRTLPIIYAQGFSIRIYPKGALRLPRRPRPDPPFSPAPAHWPGGRRLNVSVMRVVGKPVHKSGFVRRKLGTKMRTALSLIVTRGANVVEVNRKERIVFDERDLGDKWLLPNWTYLISPTLEVYNMSYESLISRMRVVLKKLKRLGDALDVKWAERQRPVRGRSEEYSKQSLGPKTPQKEKSVVRTDESSAKRVARQQQRSRTHERPEGDSLQSKRGDPQQRQLKGNLEGLDTESVAVRHRPFDRRDRPEVPPWPELLQQRQPEERTSEVEKKASRNESRPRGTPIKRFHLSKEQLEETWQAVTADPDEAESQAYTSRTWRLESEDEDEDSAGQEYPNNTVPGCGSRESLPTRTIAPSRPINTSSREQIASSKRAEIFASWVRASKSSSAVRGRSTVTSYLSPYEVRHTPEGSSLSQRDQSQPSTPPDRTRSSPSPLKLFQSKPVMRPTRHGEVNKTSRK